LLLATDLLNACFWQLAAGFWLLATCFWLLATGLLDACFWLLAACSLLPFYFCLLPSNVFRKLTEFNCLIV
jgi:hypothetical protein